MVCICLASTSPQWVTGHGGVAWCSVSTRHSAQVEMCPSEINSLTLMHTLVNDSVLPVAGRGGWPMSAFNIPILCLTFIVAETHKYLFTLPLLSPKLWYCDRFWTVHPLPVTIFTKEDPTSGAFLCTVRHVWVVMECNEQWDCFLAASTGQDHRLSLVVVQPSWPPQGKPDWLVLPILLLSGKKPFWQKHCLLF